MIDTEDLDRTLRAAFRTTAERDASFDDPAPRVAHRVTRRRRRRIASRVSVLVVIALLAAATIGGLYSSTRRTGPAFEPLETPSVLLTPQTPADLSLRDAFSANALRFFNDNIDWTSIRLLQRVDGAAVFGTRDPRGRLCIVVGFTGGGSNCSKQATTNSVMTYHARKFAEHGSLESVYETGHVAIGAFLPDSIRHVTLNGRPLTLVRNSVLVVYATSKPPVWKSVTRRGDTLRITLSKPTHGPPANSGVGEAYDP